MLAGAHDFFDSAAEVFVNLLGVSEKDNPTVGSGDDSGNCIIL